MVENFTAGVRPTGYSNSNPALSGGAIGGGRISPRADFPPPPAPPEELLKAALAPPNPPNQTYTEPPPKTTIPPAEDSTQYKPAEVALDSEWERIDLPSNFIFYEWDSISAKQFGVRDQAKLARAIRQRNITTLLDVLAATCNRDVRELAYGDFRALCLWHKLNSYVNSPYEVSWDSKYGIRGKNTINRTRIKVSKLTATREDYLGWQERGFAISTTRDMELIAAGNLDEDSAYLFDKAQFISLNPLAAKVEQFRKRGNRAPTVAARIEELERRGLKVFSEISDFSDLFSDFGVTEYADVTLDTKDFKPDLALVALRGSTGEFAEERLAEAEDLALAIDRGIVYVPKREEVLLGFNLWGMFPYT
jgi:hypothetical protein